MGKEHVHEVGPSEQSARHGRWRVSRRDYTEDFLPSLPPLHATAEMAPVAPGAQKAMLELLAYLRGQAYEFTTVTPLTHARVLRNRGSTAAAGLRDIFGWSQPFAPQQLPADLLKTLRQEELLLSEGGGGLLRSGVRVSSFDGDLFVHSAFPTLDQDAVFFGPDTCRFLCLVRDNLPATRPAQVLRIADVGCGSGAGGIVAARLRGGASLLLNDINPLALAYAGINARSAGVDVELAAGDALAGTSGNFDVVLASPPYLVDDAARAYRHGGADLGRALSVRIGSQALQRLSPGGTLILYTGVAMVDGIDLFIRDMEPFLGEAGCTYTYAEIDPDVFGEELDRPAYQQADRIAAVGLVAVKP